MGIVNQLLASEYTGAKFIDGLVEVLTMIMAVVGILFILYAVYIAYLFFTASNRVLFQRESQIATARLLVNLSRAAKSILSP